MVTLTRDVRTLAGWTQAELAFYLDRSVRTVQRADVEPVDAPGAPWLLAALHAALLDGEGPVPREYTVRRGQALQPTATNIEARMGLLTYVLARASAYSPHWARRFDGLDPGSTDDQLPLDLGPTTDSTDDTATPDAW